MITPGLPSPSHHPGFRQRHEKEAHTHAGETRCSQASALKGLGECPPEQREGTFKVAGPAHQMPEGPFTASALRSLHKPPCTGQRWEEEDSMAKGRMFLS